MDYKDLGRRIRKERLRLNLTQAQLFGGEEDGVVYPARCDQRTYSRLVGNTTRVYFEGEDLRIK